LMFWKVNSVAITKLSGFW